MNKLLALAAMALLTVAPAHAISPKVIAYKAAHYGLIKPLALGCAGFGIVGGAVMALNVHAIYALARLDYKLNPENK
jgi:hypothetical protein